MGEFCISLCVGGGVGGNAPQNTNKPRSARNAVFAVTYFIFLTAMTAGVAQILGLWAAAASLLFCIAVVCVGFDRMITVNKYLTLFIVTFLVVVCCMNLGGAVGIYNPKVSQAFSSLPRTFLMSALYSAMNCCMLVAVIAKMRTTKIRGDIMWAGALAACIIFLLVTLVFTAIRDHMMEAMPILALCDNVLTKITLLAAIVSSQYVALFNVAELTGINKTKPRKKPLALAAVCATAFATSLIGFSKVLGVFYPVVGFCMVVYIILICLISLRRRCVCRRNRAR